MTRVLRIVAFAIAAAGVIDPAIMISGAARPRIAVVPLEAVPGAASIRDRIARDLSSSYEVVPAVTSDTAAAIVIGDRYPDASSAARLGLALPEALPIATVSLSDAVTSGARIARIDAPQEVPPATAIHVNADLDSRGLIGHTTDAIVTIAGVEAGRASHRWTADGERWRASLDVVPVGAPPYVLQVRITQDGAAAATGLSSAGRTGVDLAVRLRRGPIHVEFYDPRPSWATTFVRRALESDPRFAVAALSFTSRGIAAQSGGAAPLADPRLDAFDVVVAGGLDRLSASDAGALDRYLRERGGAVVLIPDQRIDSGPAREIIGTADLGERLLEQPAKLAVASPAPSLQASELLVFRAVPSGADVVARIPGATTEPVIVTMPRGEGRILVSGAMDAWRYRAADNAAFDRFWQSTIAGLGMAVPPPITIDVDPPLPRPGEHVTLTARVRSRGIDVVSASVGGQPVRLVPNAEAGSYRAEFTASATAGPSTIEVRSTAAAQRLAASRTLFVRAGTQRLRSSAAPPLSMLAESHRGMNVTPDQISDLARFARGAVAASRVRLARHPMRSTWWILPFAMCLSGEWWLRRRRGLR